MQSQKSFGHLFLWVLLPITALALGDRSSNRAPQRLSDTGLYSDFPSRTIDPSNLSYSPQYPLWSDGAKKQRWIYLPPGKSVDASDPDRWKFPVGTKIWKQFSWDRPVETRYIEKVSEDQWIFASYAWIEDGSDAVLAPAKGVKNAYPLGQGKSHDIPSVSSCMQCHVAKSGMLGLGQKRIQILGFSALQLSPDRDPNAPHADQLEPGMVTLPTLVEQGKLQHLPTYLIRQAPRIEASNAIGRAAMGYLHANCGTCHTPDKDWPGRLGMNLRHSVTVDVEPVLETAVGVPTSKFHIPGLSKKETDRIRSGDPAHSVVPYRMGSRIAHRQMPPVGTALVDEEALELVKLWIRQDLR